MIKKISILTLTLLIPVLIYVFLKSFGTNTYEVPEYYQEGVISEYCGINTAERYQLSIEESSLFYAHTNKNKHLQFVVKEIVRIQDKSDVKIVGLYDLNEEKLSQPSGVEYQGLLPNEFVDFLSCKLLIYTQDKNVFDYMVLVDKSGIIRGYYLANDYEEYDRMFAELLILDSFSND